MTAKIDFYFDYISPYAYLAWQRLQPIAKENNWTVIPKPVLFAGFLNHCGQKGPAEIPTKRLFTFKDVLRRANRANTPMQLPPAHPFNPLLPLRLTIAAQDHPRQGELISSIFCACWANSEDITSPESLSKILDAISWENKDELLSQVTTAEVKQQLREDTETAIARGVFGVPTFCVDEEVFWGEDQIEFVQGYLKGDDPVTQEHLATLDKMPEGARR